MKRYWAKWIHNVWMIYLYTKQTPFGQTILFQSFFKQMDKNKVITHDKRNLLKGCSCKTLIKLLFSFCSNTNTQILDDFCFLFQEWVSKFVQHWEPSEYIRHRKFPGRKWMKSKRRKHGQVENKKFSVHKKEKKRNPQLCS